MRELQPIHTQSVDKHPDSDSYATLTRKKRTRVGRDITYPDHTMTRSEYHAWLARNDCE